MYFNFLEEFLCFSKIISSKGIHDKVKEINERLFLLRYTCQRGMKLAKWIYDDSGLRLERKFAQYNAALRAREVV